MTPNARALGVALLGMLGGALSAFAPACSLDWTVRADPADGAALDSSGPDGAVGETGSDAPADAPGDSAIDAGPCSTLAADVAKARAKAKECQLGTAGQCTTTVKDECDCDVVVRAASSVEDAAYATAIAALIVACGKPAACGACKQLGLPASWACLRPASVTECLP